MLRSPQPWPLAPFLTALACGPDVPLPQVDGESADTEAADTDTDTDTVAVPAVTRILYPTAAGIVARASIEGDLEAPELVTSGAWSNLGVDRGRFVAAAAEGAGHLFGDATLTPATTFAVDCPVEDGCWSTVTPNAWVLSQRILAQGAASEHYWVDAAGPLLLYTAEPEGLVGFTDEALIALETTAGGARLVRVPLSPGARAEALLDVDSTYSAGLRGDLVVLRPPSDVVWYDTLGLVDVSAEQPRLVVPALLPGRTLHGVWTAGSPGEGGVFVTQGDAELGADVAWVALDPGASAATVLVSSGATEGKVAFGPSANPISTSPGGGWVALSVRMEPEGDVVTHLVPRERAAFGEPVSLGAGTRVAHFAPDDGAVFFWSVDEEGSSLLRAPLEGGAVGAASLLFEAQEGRHSILAEDGSTLAVITEGESAGLWVVDLSDAGAPPRRVAACGEVNISARISADGSLLACSWGEDFTEGREHVVLDVRGGEVRALADATELPSFVALPPAR